jgi:hypothetical protein
MKWQFVFLLFAASTAVTFSQNNDSNIQRYLPIVNIGLSSGSNNFTSYIGLLAEVNPVKNTTILGGVGYGPWGVKSSVGMRYYHKYPKGIYCGLSFSSCAGRNNDTLSLETFISDSVKNQDVILNLKKARTLNLTLGYDWQFWKRFRFFVELGYSIPLQKDPYEIISKGIVLTESGKQSIYQMEPGGYIFGWGLTVGF